MAVHKVKETLTLNRPAYVGMRILDLSKMLRRLLLCVRAGDSTLAKSMHAIEMYQHQNSHTACYTCKLPKSH